MRSLVLSLLLFLLPAAAFADGPKKKQQDTSVVDYFGAEMDLGVPKGGAISVLFRPVPWFHTSLGLSYNGFGPGGFLGATFDPIKFPVAPTLTGEFGGNVSGSLPGVSNSPEISYIYANVYPGIEFGNRDRFRFHIRGGVSWINGTVHNFSDWTRNKDQSLIFSKPTFSATLLPTADIGFSVFF